MANRATVRAHGRYVGDRATATTATTVTTSVQHSTIRLPLPGSTASMPVARMLPPSIGLSGSRLTRPRIGPAHHSASVRASVRTSSYDHGVVPSARSSARAEHDLDDRPGGGDGDPFTSAQPARRPVRRPPDEEAERDRRLGAESAGGQRVAELVHEGEGGDGADQAEGERRVLQVQPRQQQQAEQEPGRDGDREAEDGEGGTVADRPDRMAARPRGGADDGH